jgi:hypothetical protein
MFPYIHVYAIYICMQSIFCTEDTRTAVQVHHCKCVLVLPGIYSVPWYNCTRVSFITNESTMRSGTSPSRNKQPKQRRFVPPTLSMSLHNDLPVLVRPHSLIAASKFALSLGATRHVKRSNMTNSIQCADYSLQFTEPSLI